jgi:hypothetical protein
MAGKKSGHIGDLISFVADILKRTYFNKYSKAKSDGWRKKFKSKHLSNINLWEALQTHLLAKK